jgi:hypothetical protein
LTRSFESIWQVAHSEKAMLDAEAKGCGELRGTKSHQQCWSRRFVAAVLVLLREVDG